MSYFRGDGMRWSRVFLLVASLTACGDPPVVPPPPPPFVPVVVTGTYALQSIKGGALPWVQARKLDGTPSQEITGGSVVLASNLTFTRTTHYRYTASDGAVSTTSTISDGTYTKNDTTGAVTLRLGTAIHDGQVEGKTLTVSFAGCCEPWVMVRP